MWHLLTLGAMVACGWLSAWQWHRAGSAMGSALNVGYGLQWPLFAVFFGVMWWRMLRMEAAGLTEGDEGDDHADGTADDTVADARGVTARRDPGPSPFGPRPERTLPAAVTEDDAELTEYNRMLAQLAARNPED